MPFYSLQNLSAVTRDSLVLPLTLRRKTKIIHWYRHPWQTANNCVRFGAADDFDEPVNVVSDLLSDPEVDPTVVALPEVPEDDYQQEQAREPEAPAVAVAAVQFDLHMEQRVVNGPLYREQVGEDNELEEDAYYSQDDSPDSPPHAPVADMELDDGELAGDELPEPALAEPVSVKKRGRPSLSAGKTPTKSTPASKNGTAERSTASRSAGRKRKAEESDEADEADEEPAAEATPARKRGRPAAPKTGAASAASARLAAKATKAPKRGRPAVTSSVRSICNIHRNLGHD